MAYTKIEILEAKQSTKTIEKVLLPGFLKSKKLTFLFNFFFFEKKCLFLVTNVERRSICVHSFWISRWHFVFSFI